MLQVIAVEHHRCIAALFQENAQVPSARRCSLQGKCRTWKTPPVTAVQVDDTGTDDGFHIGPADLPACHVAECICRVLEPAGAAVEQFLPLRFVKPPFDHGSRHQQHKQQKGKYYVS